jgi:inosine-uridine nucleoside N-ribohydrolase
MGGGTFGNRSATGEFNIWADPEAAAHRVRLRRPARDGGARRDPPVAATPERIAAIAALPGRMASLFADLFEFFSDNYRVSTR